MNQLIVGKNLQYGASFGRYPPYPRDARGIEFFEKGLETRNS